MKTNGYHDYQVSTILAAHETTTETASFRAMLEEIKSPRWRPQVEAVRSAYAHGGKDEAAAPKKKLPGILFSGTFAKRSASALTTHSGLICVDLDDLGEGVEGMREHIASDPHTLAAFISPTGTGLKVIFRCDPKRPHIESFKAAEQFVKNTFGLEIDQACKDVSRICFVSHDPDAFVADDAELLTYSEHTVELPHRELKHVAPGITSTPGDDYDTRGDFTDLLIKHGWTEARKPYWTRPGASGRISASWDVVPGRFYVFSDQAAPLQPNHVYRPWHVFALLESNGDYKEAARKLGRMGYGEQHQPGTPLPNPAPAVATIDLGEDDFPPAINHIPGIRKENIQRKPSEFLLAPDDDASVLLGNRFLNRGDGGILVGSSGMGKSSASIQMSVSWALNLPFQGIKPNGCLRILIIQSEDSDGDIAEVMLSMRHMMNLTPEQIEQVDQNVRIVCDRVNRGDNFISALKKHIADFAPDLVIINPLQAFIDGDVTESRDLGKFLRGGLNGLNDNKFGYLLVHHTTKPSTGKDRGDRQWHEVMYDMAGGAELINWARFVISLRATATPGDFNLVLAKRGRRANVTAITGEPPFIKEEIITSIPVRHSTGTIPVPGRRKPVSVIFWEPRELTDDEKPKAPASGAPEKFPFNHYSNVIPARSSLGKTYSQLKIALDQNGPIPKGSYSNVLKKWIDAGDLEKLVPDGLPVTYRRTL